MSLLAETLEVSRSNLYKQRTSGVRRRRYKKAEDASLLLLIKEIITERQTYGYRRVLAILNKQLATQGKAPVNHKRIYRIMSQNSLLLCRKTGERGGRGHDGKVETAERNTRWCSDGFEIRCSNGERVRVLFGMDTCDREIMAYAATTSGYTSDMVQSVMLSCLERRFHQLSTPRPVEWLSDNGSCYRASETQSFGANLGLVCRYTPVRSPQSNGMAEAFVKTFRRDYINNHPRPTASYVLEQLPKWIEDYNENAPHKGLKMLSPREYIRRLDQGKATQQPLRMGLKDSSSEGAAVLQFNCPL